MRHGNFYGQVALFELGQKLSAHVAEQPEGKSEADDGNGHHHLLKTQCFFEHRPVNPLKEVHDPVGYISFVLRVLAQKQGAYHGYVGER
ncbi:hypothetical protein D3C86_1636150 [compost metagenome]